ncbi:MAG: phage minor head protein [Actinomycetota bacterium]
MNSNWEIARKIQEDLKRVEARVGKDAVRLYRQAWEELERDLVRYLYRIAGSDGTVNTSALYGAGRALSLRAQIDSILSDYSESVSKMLDREVDRAATRYLQKYGMSVEAILPPGFSIALDRMWPEVVTAILNRKWEGVHFSERLGFIAPEVADEMMDQLAIGAMRGEGIHPLMMRLQGTADISRYRAEMIARTEIIRASNTACDWTYAQYEGLVQAKRRLVTLDTRTCVACLAQDGKVYQLQDPMDDHVMGRCTFTAITPSWEELGYHGQQPPYIRRARDPFTHRNEQIPFTDARSWFEGLPDGVQRQMMGPTRWGMWKDGLVDWDHLYGAGSSITAVRDLRNVAGGL